MVTGVHSVSSTDPLSVHCTAGGQASKYLTTMLLFPVTLTTSKHAPSITNAMYYYTAQIFELIREKDEDDEFQECGRQDKARTSEDEATLEGIA